MSHTQSDESPDEEAVFPFLIDSLDDSGQTQFCKNLLVNLFEPGISTESIRTESQQYGIYTIEFSTPQTAHGKYVIQTDDIELEFAKVIIEYIKSIQHHNSQRANSIFTNEVFAIIYSYISILEKKQKFKVYHQPKHPNIQKYEIKSQCFQHFYI